MANQVYQTVAATDLSGAAATGEQIKAPFAGKVKIAECYVRAGEVVGAATTAATITLDVGGTTVATMTPSSTTLDTIGDTQTFTSSITGDYHDFAAGDVISTVHTQATGGTTTGTVYWHLAIEWAK